MGKVWAVIVAAGKGRRMKSDRNKQFINIKDKPVLYYTLKAFSSNIDVDKIVVVCSKDEIDYCMNQIINKYNFSKVVNIVEGGLERQESVFNGLKVVDDCEIVLIHDGARPFVSNKIIQDGINYAQTYGACACGVTPKDTIKIKDEDGFSVSTIKRDNLFSVQTPQVFRFNLILNCYKNLKDKDVSFTDDTSVVEYFGNKVFLYHGSYNNIKITTPEDLIIAENILTQA